MTFSDEEKERYSRHLILDQFGLEGQQKLKGSSVLVVGAGGLGCPCLLYLVAAGIGHIGIADDDFVSLSNLQRQVLYATDDIGKPKSVVACQKLLKRNPSVKITTFQTRITKDNALEILKDYDVIIDGSDNFPTRYLLNDTCVILNKPLIYGALFKFEGQVSTFNYKGGPTYRCLFPQSPAKGEMPGCGEVGVLGVLPGIIGTWQATEAIKVIAGIGEPLSGKLLIINLLSNEISTIKFSLVEGNRKMETLGDYSVECTKETDEIDSKTFLDLLKQGTIELIDVREEYEFEKYNIGGINIPLSELEERINEIKPDQITVCVCSTGNRSEKAVKIIKNYFNTSVSYHLKEGLQAL